MTITELISLPFIFSLVFCLTSLFNKEEWTKANVNLYVVMILFGSNLGKEGAFGESAYEGEGVAYFVHGMNI